MKIVWFTLLCNTKEIEPFFSFMLGLELKEG